MAIKNDKQTRIAVLGATRGLGLEIVKQILSSIATSSGESFARRNLLGVGRRWNKQNEVTHANFEAWTFDLTQTSKLSEFTENLSQWAPTHVFYVAGGGPWGLFAEQALQAHQWALQLNLLTPMLLLHGLARQSRIIQWVSVGSAIAESHPDRNASSYSAAKHALKGLITTIQSEGLTNLSGSPIDVRLYSPGYMDTALLPAQFKSQLKLSNQILDPAAVAQDLLAWCRDDSAFSGHRILQP